MNRLPSDPRDRLNVLVQASKQYEGQAEQLQIQMDLINQTIAATRITSETIENLTKLEEGQELLMPLGNIAFIKAKIMDPQKVLINVGASVVIEKTIEKAKDTLDQRMENLNKSQMQLRQVFQQVIQNLQSIREQIDQLASQMQRGSRGPAVGS